MEDNLMNSEYTATEIIEVGKAQEVILGQKPFDGIDVEESTQPNADLDE
jgi:hypothetical protein